MSYKIIVVQIDDTDSSMPRMELAASIALAEEAHLVGVAVARDRAEEEQKAGNATDIARNEGAAPGWGHDAAFERFEQSARRSGVITFEKRLIEGDPAVAFSHQGRQCDLLVLGQGDNAPGAATPGADFVEYVVMNSGCPVLVVPGTNLRSGHKIDNRILIGWNASTASARAVRDAMPFLARARALHVAVLDAGPAPHASHEAPGADIAVYLDRHGLPVQVHHRDAVGDAGNALLDLAHRLSCSLLVMGGVAYPHGRDMLPGGATRSVLMSARIPVLLSH
jgi:nucleotide-binding universal stress UspA family protein